MNIFMVLEREYTTAGAIAVLIGIASVIAFFMVLIWANPKKRLKIGIGMPILYAASFLGLYALLIITSSESIYDVVVAGEMKINEIAQKFFWLTMWIYLIMVAISGPVMWYRQMTGRGIRIK